jgi:hypothetical protein
MTPTFYPGDRVRFVHPDAHTNTATVILVVSDVYIVQLDNGQIVPAFYLAREMRLMSAAGRREQDYGDYAVYILENLYRVREGFEIECFEEWLESEGRAEAAEDGEE